MSLRALFKPVKATGLVLAWVFFVLGSDASAQLTWSNWTYTIYSEGSPPVESVAVIGYSGAAGTVAVPQVIDGRLVKRVGNGSATIDPQSRITNFSVPDTVTSIAPYAFYSRRNLASLDLGNGVTNIGLAAFASCIRLTSVRLPESVKSLGDYAFYNAFSLTNAVLSGNLTNIGFATFADCPKLPRVVIHPGVTDIGDYAFNNGVGITNVSIPVGVTNIGNFAFSFCRSLPRITIPDSVRRIGTNAFASCYALAQLDLGRGVTDLADAAFIYCDGLTSVTIPDSVSFLPTDLFFDSANLSSVIVGAGVVGIGDDAFGGCEKLTSILFRGTPPSLTGVNANIFGDSLPIVLFLPVFPGWGLEFGGRPTAAFAPRVVGLSRSEGGFAFTWAGTLSIPMAAQRTQSLANGPWETVATGLTNGVFVDTDSPPESAYYRALVP